MEQAKTILMYTMSVLLVIEGLWALFSEVPLVQWVKEKRGGFAGKGLAVFFVVLGTLLLAAILWTNIFQAEAELEVVSGKVFRQEKVILDGYFYRRCEFHNVTWVYNGGRFGLIESQVFGSTNIDVSGNSSLSRFIRLLKEAGVLKPEVQTYRP